MNFLKNNNLKTDLNAVQRFLKSKTSLFLYYLGSYSLICYYALKISARYDGSNSIDVLAVSYTHLV